MAAETMPHGRALRLLVRPAATGRRSLNVFCGGVLLAWAASIAPARRPGEAAWLDPAPILGGVAALSAVALRRGGRREAPRQRPMRAAA